MILWEGPEAWPKDFEHQKVTDASSTSFRDPFSSFPVGNDEFLMMVEISLQFIHGMAQSKKWRVGLEKGNEDASSFTSKRHLLEHRYDMCIAPWPDSWLAHWLAGELGCWGDGVLECRQVSTLAHRPWERHGWGRSLGVSLTKWRSDDTWTVISTRRNDGYMAQIYGYSSKVTSYDRR